MKLPLPFAQIPLQHIGTPNKILVTIPKMNTRRTETNGIKNNEIIEHAQGQTSEK